MTRANRERKGARRPLTEFLATESAGGIVLLAATAFALVWANGPWRDTYAEWWTTRLTIGAGDLAIREDLRHWVNDGLMAIFFFVVGLEIKRELAIGELRDRRKAALPVIAALGGMAVPAAIYAAWNAGGDGSRGWAIPMATDIAFAVGVLAILGPRIPPALRLFLLTLAIVDDIGAIIVIALLYSTDLEPLWLVGALLTVVGIVALRRFAANHPLAYVGPALALWVCVFESGVHATIAGVVLGLLTPARASHGPSPIERLEHRFHPVASFAVIPLFALANAGVAVGADSLSDAAASPITWGVVTGLVLGKVAGIAGAATLAVRLRACRLPEGVDTTHILGVGALAGIGFTVSLFVAELSFDGAVLEEATLGVLLSSILSGAFGVALLHQRSRA